jgi:hypothetical protein
MSTRRVHVRFGRTVAVVSSLALALFAGAMPASADATTVTVSGHVLGPGAVGVEDAAVRVSCTSGGVFTPQTTNSAADGSWSVQVPQGAPCAISASKLVADLLNTYYGSNTNSAKYFTFDTDTAGIDWQLTQGGSVSGKVTVPEGYSTVGMTVYPGALAHWFDLGEDGTYVIHGLTVGTHNAWVYTGSGSDLYADPISYANPAQWYIPYVVTAGATTTGVDFTVHVGGSITGVLTHPEGWPADGIRVEALTPGGSVAADAYSDGSGRYALHALPPGSYVLQFGYPGGPEYMYPGFYYPGTKTVADATTIEVAAGQVATVDQVVHYNPSVSGYVVDGKDAGVAGIAVSLEPVAGGASIDAGTTDANGLFNRYLPDLNAGSYRVRFVPPAGSGYAPTYYGGSTSAHATPIALAGPDSRVSGVFAILPPASTPGRYVAQPPTRVLDTRLTGDGKLRAYDYRTIDLDPGDTTGMTAAVLNITTTRTECLTAFLSAGPALLPTERPSWSVVNARWLADVPNMVTVQVAPGGLVTLYDGGCNTDVVIDLEGYYTAGGGAGYVPAPSPARVLDTRSTANPFRAGETRRVDLSGVVPTGAVAAMVTLTSTRATGITYLSAFPTGSTGGTGTSVVNAVPGADIANSAPVQLAADGTISVYNNAGQVDVIVDVVGWYVPDGGADFWPLAPARAASSGGLGPAQTRLVSNPDERIPANAVAVALNLTTTQTAGNSYVVAYPAAGERPATSNGNARGGLDVANGTIVGLSDGGYRVYNNAGTVTVLEDVFGYFAPAA